MILTWMRGPAGSPTDYLHSEGVCCSLDEVDGVPGAHKQCRADLDYTLRKAYQDTCSGIDTDESYGPAPDWCSHCDGRDQGCPFCHTATELFAGALSQRGKALEVLRTVWGGELPDFFCEAAGIAREG